MMPSPPQSTLVIEPVCPVKIFKHVWELASQILVIMSFELDANSLLSPSYEIMGYQAILVTNLV
jgi:hypothetical protein